MDIEILNKYKGAYTIVYSSLAYAKLLACFNTELAKTYEFGWFCISDKKNKTYYIKDILIMPQTVQGAHFETDDDKYPEWAYKYREQLKQSRGLGHSHVNMSTNPSGTDVQQFSELMSQVSDYFIQIIMNHNHSDYHKIYDLQDNLIIGNPTIIIQIKDTLYNLTDKKIINSDLIKTDRPILLDKGSVVYSKTGVYLELDENGFHTYLLDDYLRIEVNTGKMLLHSKELIEQMQKEIDSNCKKPVLPYQTVTSYNSYYYNNRYNNNKNKGAKEHPHIKGSYTIDDLPSYEDSFEFD